MSKFCTSPLFKDISKILHTHLISSSVNLVGIYDKFIKLYDDTSSADQSFVEISKNDIVGYGDLLQKKEVQNLGIDLPIYFGNPLQEQRIMIVAMDPKRSGQENDRVSIGSVFALHQYSARTTKKNDYWKFIEPLTTDHFVYLTDVFKLYYETSVAQNGRISKLLSNKDPEFTAKDQQSFQKNKLMLEEEINLVKPTTIIALGNEAAAALKTLCGIRTNELEITHNNIKYLFMPHISRTVTQNIGTIAHLFIALGKLKQNSSMIRLGEEIQLNKENLFV